MQKSDSRRVADQGRKGHDRAKFVIPERVEHIPRNSEPHVPQLLGREFPKHEVSHGKKGKKKYAAVEEHEVVSGRTSA
jgi:hypothetical protein